MENQAEIMNKILSTIYLGFDILYFLVIIKSICKSSKKLTRTLTLNYEYNQLNKNIIYWIKNKIMYISYNWYNYIFPFYICSTNFW